MPFFVELGTAVAASMIAGGALKAAPEAKNYLADVIERLKDGSLGIFVFGCQGAGKSTLAATLSGQRTIYQPTNPYKSTEKIEEARLPRNRFFSVVDAPGQVGMAEDDWPVLIERLSRTKRAICIYCSAHGHHAPHKVQVSKTVDTDQALGLPEYLGNRRELEVKQLGQLVDGLINYRGKVSFISLVTKQDLWWTERSTVEEFYDASPFIDDIERLRTRKQKDGFQYAQCSVSLSLENMIDASTNEILSPTTEGYDQATQAINYQNFTTALERMIKG